MKAARIPIVGRVEVVELAEPVDDDARTFLADLYSVIGCTSVECVTLTEHADAWLDETGWIAAA